MDADDLQQGFQLGDWRVAPDDMQLAGPLGTRTLQPWHVRLLLELARHHGEAIETSALARLADMPEDSIVRHLDELSTLLGDTPDRRRYIVPVGDDAYALIAHFEPLGRRTPLIPASTDQRSAAATAAPGTTVIGRLQWLVTELRRRHVMKVCGAYLIAMWIILQVAEVTFEPLHLPDWWMTALTIAAVIGLPIVAVLAWWYEITPGGIELDSSGAGAAHMALPRPRRSVAPVAVAGMALLAGITGIAWWRSLEAPETIVPLAATMAPTAAPAAPSVAVLALVDMSPGGGYAYLGDGLSEELATRLAQVPGLRVAARTSAFEFKDRPGDVRRIGQALGVRHVLEGSVRRDGGNLRVTVQLIDAQNGFRVWTERYDRPWSDVIAVQDDIARAVTQALRVVLTPGSPADREDTVDLRAFDVYLAGLAMLRNSGDVSQLNEARRNFLRALDIDPGFARAHAGLCEIGVRRHDFTRDPGDLATAEQHCNRALELNSSLLETEKARAALYVSGGRYAAARAAYEALLRSHPSDADGAIGLGRALAGEGDKTGAERSYRRAVAIEPGFWGAYRALGGLLFQQGRLRDAIAAYRKVVELTPSSASAHNNLGAALQMQGSLEEASKSFERSLQLEPSRSAYSNLGFAYYYLGRFEAAADSFSKASALAAQDHVLWGNLADALWQIPGRREEALANYRRAIALAERDAGQTPRNAYLLAQLSYYYAQTGERDQSQRRAQAAVEIDPAQPYVRYYTALAAIGRRETSLAINELEAAVAAGYPTTSLATAPELAVIRSERGFAALVARSVGPAEKPEI